MLNSILAFLLGLLVTFISTPLVKKMALTIGAVDMPNQRRLNSKPVPNLGGIAIYLGFVISVLLFSPAGSLLTGILLGGTVILLTGIIDDLRELPPFVKLLGQITAASILILYGVRVEFITNPFGGMFYLGFWGIPLTILWIVGITNTLNLIDGLDGLASGVATIASLTLFFVGLQEGQVYAPILSLALAGSALGFLKYNFNPAEIYMGDTGAMFLGYILAAVSAAGALKSAAAVTIIVPLLALGVPIFDTVFAIIRRICNGKPIGEADNGHIHHRLLALGMDQRQAVMTVYGVSFFLGLVALVINSSNFYDAIIVFFMVVVALVYGAWKLGIFSVEIPGEGVNPTSSKEMG
ncbi:MraY family glycosyltransferase [Halothermothrix orenii]|uniref:Glycosyl transferase family 4 n=1 Tax=Halothermothrix orenii (strain H 168 / OCM 544 / DSM 9562) TaxID=373903 RepID=B8CZ21_HALOH|nr:MraY family glycosyltransferase [Halothermothrix orenii]ACL70540.1 glycosyl transferase family 4 [Halothermothrix orenii H 168]